MWHDWIQIKCKAFWDIDIISNVLKSARWSLAHKHANATYKRPCPRLVRGTAVCMHPYKQWQLCKQANTHILQNHHTHTHTVLLAGWQTLWADTRPLMACWVHPLCLVKSVCMCVFVCVCVFVVKSTLATVCLSISPVWQRWKELLFRGQPHPTLINSAARASGREGGMDGGAEVEADRGGWEETEGAWRCSRPKNRRHPVLSSVPTPFPAWIPFYFYLCLIHSFSIYFFWTNPLIFSLH